MTDDLLGSMRRRLADAEADAEALRAAIAVLENGATASITEAARRPRAPRRAAGDLGAAVVVALGTLLSVVAEYPGQTNSWLVKHTGGDQTQLLALLKMAEREGSV